MGRRTPSDPAESSLLRCHDNESVASYLNLVRVTWDPAISSPLTRVLMVAMFLSASTGLGYMAHTLARFFDERMGSKIVGWVLTSLAVMVSLGILTLATTAVSLISISNQQNAMAAWKRKVQPAEMGVSTESDEITTPIVIGEKKKKRLALSYSLYCWIVVVTAIAMPLSELPEVQKYWWLEVTIFVVSMFVAIPYAYGFYRSGWQQLDNLEKATRMQTRPVTVALQDVASGNPADGPTTVPSVSGGGQYGAVAVRPSSTEPSRREPDWIDKYLFVLEFCAATISESICLALFAHMFFKNEHALEFRSPTIWPYVGYLLFGLFSGFCSAYGHEKWSSEGGNVKTQDQIRNAQNIRLFCNYPFEATCLSGLLLAGIGEYYVQVFLLLQKLKRWYPEGADQFLYIQIGYVLFSLAAAYCDARNIGCQMRAEACDRENPQPVLAL